MTDMIEALRELIAIESVADPECNDPAHPYGTGVGLALEYVLELCRGFGFETKNCAGQVGWSQIGSGEPMTAILVHLDTVPMGTGWTRRQGEIYDGKLYGRGAVDDKGPAVASIYAMKRILDSGKPIHGRVRIIFGQTEETGNWPDMEYYISHEELPDQGFTPDADFPLIFAEKGICMLEFRAKAPKGLTIHGGTTPNVVPDQCMGIIPMKNGTFRELHTKGKAAHGSTPEQGINAISLLMGQLYGLHMAGEIEFPFAAFYHDAFETDLQGSLLGGLLEDAVSGKRTMNCGVIACENGHVRLMVDTRYPVTGNCTNLMEAVATAAAEQNVQVSCLMHKPPVYLEKDDPFISVLLDTYREVTGDVTPPLCIGGGTYARAMDHIVAFGPLMPGRPMTEHQPDEYVIIRDLEQAARVYEQALRALHMEG